jgi:hypothetical protein
MMTMMSRVAAPMMVAIVCGRRIMLRRLRCRGHRRRHSHGRYRRHSRERQKNSCSQQKLAYTVHHESPATRDLQLAFIET